LILKYQKEDLDGHQEMILLLQKKLRPEINANGSFKAPSAFDRDTHLAREFWRDLAEARNNREIVDYSPYLSSKGADGEIIHLSGNSLEAASTFNLTCAELALKAADAFVFR
jgi:hypothetical protein